MSSQSKKTLWSLKDVEADHRVDGLPLDKALILILGIAPARLHHWQAKSSAQNEWGKLWEFPELGLKPPPVPGRKREKAKTNSGVEIPGMDDSTLEVDIGALQDRRSSRRYQKAFELIVYGEKKNFKTKTVNISMSGILLADDIPSWVNEPFSAVLAKNNERLRLILSRLDERDPRTFRIEEVDPPELLREWLLKW